MQAMIQLEFNGQCREAFEFYAKLFKGEIKVMNPFGGQQDPPLPPGSRPAGAERIRFAQLQFGDNVIQANDMPEDEVREMRGFNIALHVQTAAEARRLFEALGQGGQVDTPLGEVAWSSAFGLLRDRFGTPWLILALDK